MRQPLFAALCATMSLFSIAPCASAQLDPLLFLKGAKPHVLVGLDLSSRMQRDPQDRYYDPVIFERTGEAFEAALGISEATADRAYRRRYTQLAWSAPESTPRAVALSVEAVGDRDPAFALFDGLTRIGRARAALRRVIETNTPSSRFGLVTTRQSAPRLDSSAWPVIAVSNPGGEGPTDSGTPGQWRAGIPLVDAPGASAPSAAPRVASDGAGANTSLSRLLERRPGDAGGLLPAGLDGPAAIDAPLGCLLEDLRAEAARLIAGDGTCCNTVVVLITAGGDPSRSAWDFGEMGAAFLSTGGRRVPVYVIALAPPAGDRPQLEQLAARSGGLYTEIAAESLDGVPGGEAVPGIVAALNLAVQHAFASFSDVNAMPSLAQPTGPPSFFPTAAPVVGTVNLENALDAAGQRLPDTRVTGPSGQVIPQRSNVLFTAGFQLPGFLGRLTGVRVYRPAADSRQATGYRFTADGTRLWVASSPPAPQRNVYTVVPGSGLVPFRPNNAELLAPFLRVADPAALVDAIRGLPLGALVNSTPALLEPPSSRVEDGDYAAFMEAHKDRRALVFAGAGDGMMHAFDARTGVEVWAVIPFNLLPKLHLLREGRPIDGYPYFVDGSPRLADVRLQGAWRTLLVFGEGPGGTFYQAFDVTLDGIAASVPPGADDVPALLAWFSLPQRVPFKWSFPRYDQFDAAIAPAGDLRSSATEAEKSVGETWSTPALGRAGGPAGTFVAIVGSGRLARSREREAQRGGTRAGTRLYLLDLGSGTVLDSRDVGNDGVAEDDCAMATCAGLKNALQADPAAVGAPEAPGVVRRIYEGDLDGRVWRFDLAEGPGPPQFAGAPRLLFAGGADQPIFGSVAVLAGTAGQSYLFLGTGSDLLPRAGTAGASRLLGLADSGEGTGRLFERLLRSAATDGMDEGIAGAAVMAGSVVFFATNTGRPGGRCDPVETSLYALTIGGGIAYDADADGRRDPQERPVVSRVRSGRGSPPATADRHLFLVTGDRLQVFGDPDGFDAVPGYRGLRIISWREVR